MKKGMQKFPVPGASGLSWPAFAGFKIHDWKGSMLLLRLVVMQSAPEPGTQYISPLRYPDVQGLILTVKVDSVYSNPPLCYEIELACID